MSSKQDGKFEKNPTPLIARLPIALDPNFATHPAIGTLMQANPIRHKLYPFQLWNHSPADYLGDEGRRIKHNCEKCLITLKTSPGHISLSFAISQLGDYMDLK